MKTEYSYNPTTVYIDPNAIDMEEYGAPMSEENPMKVVVKEVGETPDAERNRNELSASGFPLAARFPGCAG